MSKVLIEEQTLYDIGDAIRVRVGNETTYKPGEMANAILSFNDHGYAVSNSVPDPSVGINGDVRIITAGVPLSDDQSLIVRYLTMRIYNTRKPGSGMHLTRIVMMTPDENIIPYPNGTTIESTAPAANANQVVTNLLNDDLNANYYTAVNPSDSSPIDITITFGSSGTSLESFLFGYYSSGDTAGRDPIVYDIIIGTDSAEYIVSRINHTSNLSTSRRALIALDNVYVGEYVDLVLVKQNGIWVNLVGAAFPFD